MFNIHQTKDGTHARRIRMPETHPTQDKKLPHPAARAPRIFADTATFADIEPLYRAGIISGVTTNPTLMKKAGASSWAHAEKLARELLELVAPNPVNLELIELTEDAMIRQAEEIAAWGENVIINLNNTRVPTNPFVNKIIGNTVRGMVSSLKGVSEINKINISIRR